MKSYKKRWIDDDIKGDHKGNRLGCDNQRYQRKGTRFKKKSTTSKILEIKSGL